MTLFQSGSIAATIYGTAILLGSLMGWAIDSFSWRFRYPCNLIVTAGLVLLILSLGQAWSRRGGSKPGSVLWVPSATLLYAIVICYGYPTLLVPAPFWTTGNITFWNCVICFPPLGLAIWYFVPGRIWIGVVGAALLIVHCVTLATLIYLL